MSEPTAGKRNSLVEQAVRYRFVSLPVSLLLLIVGWPIARQLRFDQSIESLYSANDPHLVDYLESKSLFGGDEFAFVAFTDPELLDKETGRISAESAQRIRELTKILNENPGVNSASSQDLADVSEEKPINLKIPIPFTKRFLTIENATIPTDTLHRLLQGVLISEDKQTTAIVLRLKPESDENPRGKSLTEIRRIAKEFGEQQEFPIAVVGEPVQVHDMFRYVEEDGGTLFRWSLSLLALVIFMLFRSLRWVVLPLLVVVTTLIWTEALLVLSGAKLSMVSSMMNSLVTIIGVATVTHVTVHYREARRELNREEALKKTLGELLPAIVWSCGTTAVGFAALLASDIMPVKSFGLMMALATLLVILTVTFLLPGGILAGKISSDPHNVPAEKHLTGMLVHSVVVVRKHSVIVAGMMIAIMGFSAIGFQRLDVETDFSKNFRESSPIVQSLTFFEDKMGGAGTWEVNFPAPEKLDSRYLKHVEELARVLREEFVREGEGEITKLVALTDALKEIPPPVVRLVLRKKMTIDERLAMMAKFQPEFNQSLYHPEQGRMRIVFRSREQQQSAVKLELIARVETVVAKWWAENDDLSKEFPNAKPKATGLYVLLAFLIDNLLKDQLLSFGLAALGIASMMMIAFRSPLIGIASLIPNLFPILLVIGGMGWLGVPINIATAMIASVSMGLTVDSSIHYISGYRRARRAGLSVDEALQHTQGHVGRALMFANLALIVGFSVLTLSHFIPLVYFGVLVSVAMAGGLVGNLVLLPLLLGWIDRNQPATEVSTSPDVIKN